MNGMTEYLLYSLLSFRPTGEIFQMLAVAHAEQGKISRCARNDRVNRAILRFVPHLLTCVAMLLLSALTAQAHTASSSFLSVQQRDATTFTIAMDVAVRDMDLLLGLDGNADGNILWAELNADGGRIADAITARTRLQRGAAACVLQPTLAQELADHGDGPYLRLHFNARCAADAGLVIDNAGWYAFDPGHRTLLEYTNLAGERQQALLTAAAPRWQASESKLARSREFFAQGVVHLLTGYDHLAFLMVLLIGLVRQPTMHRQQALRHIARRAAAVITAFTLAHSITLVLAATGHVALPSGPVEIAIAASVFLTALLTLSRRMGSQGWRLSLALAFGFGLVHGLGFAGALAELLTARIDLWSLASFNLGIEAAQLGVAALCVPVLWWVARRQAIERVALPLASLSIAAVAVQWLVVRWPM